MRKFWIWWCIVFLVWDGFWMWADILKGSYGWAAFQGVNALIMAGLLCYWWRKT